MTRSATVRLILADDHLMFVEAIRMILGDYTHIDVVAIVDNGDDLLTRLAELEPDVALVDLSMEGPSALRIADAVRKRGLKTRLIALTMHLDHGLAQITMDGGFAGYVVKDAAVQELLQAITSVHSGNPFISSAIRKLDRDFQSKAGPLTKRENECLQRASEGHSNKVIARELGVSERTVKFHFENLLRKLDAKSRGEAVAIARRSGIL